MHAEMLEHVLAQGVLAFGRDGECRHAKPRGNQRQCKVKMPYLQEGWLLTSRADLPGGGDNKRGQHAANDSRHWCCKGERCRRCTADRGEGLGKGRNARGGLAAAELAAPSLHAEPELDGGGGHRG